MIRKAFIIGVLLISCWAVAGNAVMVSAFTADNTGLTKTGSTAGLSTDKSLAQIAGEVVSALLALSGIGLMIVVIIGGLKYMLAGGEEGDVKKGKDWIKNGVIGLVIVSLAYALSTYVISRLGAATLGMDALHEFFEQHFLV